MAERPADGSERLHKILAQAGVGSRRACELLILEGRVTVDGEVVRELGTKADPATAKISVDGQRIRPEPHVHYLVYKPKGYVSTSEDPSGRPLVLDLVPKARERIFIVGRLDRFSEGLMLLTNDGALAQRLTHPSYGVEKTYRVSVAGDAGQEVIDKLTDGVWLAEGKVRARRARIVARRGNVTVLEIVLAEGKNREIRRMLARLEHKVLSLLRVAIGPLTLKGLSEGGWRTLTESEVERLWNSTGSEEQEEPRTKSPSGPRKRDQDKPRGARLEGPRARKPAGGRGVRPAGGSRADEGESRRERPSPRSGSRFEPREDRGPKRGGRPAPGTSRPAARRRPEPPPHVDDDEELVFTDRMDMDDRPAKQAPREAGSAPRGDRPRGPQPPPRGEPRKGGGKFAGKGRPAGPRSDRPDQPKRTVLGPPREPGKPVPKRRGGPSRGLPPRRRRPKDGTSSNE